MSLKNRTYDSIDARATRVLTMMGKAPLTLKAMDGFERLELSELIDEKGTPVEGISEKFRLFMVAYAERRKATIEEYDSPNPN